MAPKQTEAKVVRYLALARRYDKVVVASHQHDTNKYPSGKFDPLMAQVLTSGKAEEVAKLSIQHPILGTAHFSVSAAGNIYLVVTDQEYPQRVAFMLLEEASQGVEKDFALDIQTSPANGLNKMLSKHFKAFCNKYENPSEVDKLASVQAQVNDVKLVMQDNVERLLDNQEKLVEVQQKTEDMRDATKKFQRSATAVKRHYCKQHWKMMLIIFLVVAVLIAIIAGVASSS